MTPNLRHVACTAVLMLTTCHRLDSEPTDPAPDASPPGPSGTTIATDHGPVIGHSDGAVTSFLGIPYAAPPVGALRWRAPADAAHWTEPLDAAAFGPACAQSQGGAGQSGPFSEDCLTLNVWTSALGAPVHAPVMVFLHGGAFIHGSSNQARYDGRTIAATGGVVVVTLNYRLGALGFLAHPALTAEDTHHSSGNTGLLDQQAALRWVQANVAQFGGDPNNVTVFGESAGSMSVCLHVVSPLAAGLFRRALSESGSCGGIAIALHASADCSQPGAETLGEQLASQLGCDGAADVLGCMRSRSADDVIAAMPGSLAGVFADLALKPNIDGYVLPESPAEALAAGRINPIDSYLAGTNQDEANLFTVGKTIDTEADYEAAVAAALPSHAADAVALYPAANYPSYLAAYDAMLTDLAFACPTRAMVRGIAAHGRAAYLYELTRMTPGGLASGLGVYHGSELPFVFGNLSISSGQGADAQAFSDQLIGYWTRFARTGDPNGPGARPWPARTATTEAYLELADAFPTHTGLHTPTCDVIESWGARR